MRDDLEWHVVDVLLDLWVLEFTTDQPVDESASSPRQRFRSARTKQKKDKEERKKKKTARERRRAATPTSW
jgi:hypothetical protein